MKKTLYLLAGHLSLLLGIIGAILPLLPTTPFLLLTAYFYSKSSTRFHQWIIAHKYFGPPLKAWEENGAISLKAKILATLMLSLVIFWRIPLLKIAIVIKIMAITTLCGVLIFIWSRPHHSPTKFKNN